MRARILLVVVLSIAARASAQDFQFSPEKLHSHVEYLASEELHGRMIGIQIGHTRIQRSVTRHARFTLRQ